MKRTFLLAIIMVLFAGNASAELHSASAASISQLLASGRPTVINLGASFCIPCKEMAPILDALAKEYRNRANVSFIDISEDQAAGERFKVRLIPTQIFFNAQGKEVKRHIGFMGKGEIVKELQAAGLK